MGWVGVASGILSGTMGASSRIREAQEQKKVSNYNRKLLAYEKRYALERAKFEASRIRREGEKTVSKQNVAFAKAGVTPDSETMLEVIADTEYEYELDAKIIEYGGDIDAWRADQQSKQLKNQSISAERSSYLGAFSSLLGGASQTYASADNMRLLKRSNTPINRVRSPQAKRPM